MSEETRLDPSALKPGISIGVLRPKSAGMWNYYKLARRTAEGDGWVMESGSIIRDDAKCWSEGRVRISRLSS